MKIKMYLCGGESPVSQYPLGLGYLKTNCPRADITIVNDAKLLVDCDMIGLSANAWGIREAAGILAKTDIPVVIGGQGTLWDGLDALPFRHIVVGEGEKPLRDIINGDTRRRHVHEQVDNLDDLLPPDRGACGPVVPVLTSRGCPYRCKFCSSQHYWRKVRYHSPAYFIAEVHQVLKQYPHARTIRILDDLFIANVPRFFAIHALWMKDDALRKLRLTSFVRANMFTKEIGLAMKEMGFLSVRFGAESGSDRMLALLNKQATVDDNQRTIDIANAIGLPVTASFMHDLPGETEQDTKATKDFIARNKGKMKVRGFYKYQPFPGTDFYDGRDLLTCDMRVR